MTFRTHWIGVPLWLAPPQGGSSYHIYKLEKDRRERSFVILCVSRESTSETHTNGGASIAPCFFFVGASPRLQNRRTPHLLRGSRWVFQGRPPPPQAPAWNVVWYCTVGGRRRGTLDPRWLALMCGYIS